MNCFFKLQIVASFIFLFSSNLMAEETSDHQNHLFSVGQFKVLKLSGSYRQMGEQYGKAMKKEIEEMHSSIINEYIKNDVRCPDLSLVDFAKNAYNLYPLRFQQILEGMASSSQIDLEKIKVLNEFFPYFLRCYPYMRKLNTANHCSAITTWGNYTKDHKPLMGRNFDFPIFYEGFDKYITLIVFNPNEAGISTAVLGYPGQISSIQLFNQNGLVIENNDGSMSGDRERYQETRVPYAIKDLSIMFDCSSFACLNSHLLTARMPYPLIYNIMTPEKGFIYETTTFDVKRRESDSGLLVGTNHFVHKGWSLKNAQFKEEIKESTKRYNNLVKLANTHKGEIDTKIMMKILDLPAEKGGATKIGSSPMIHTIYQFVYSPSELKLHLKAPAHTQWTEIDLAKYFEP